MLSRKDVENTGFYVVEGPYGWLAVSRPESSLQIGVMGPSER